MGPLQLSDQVVQKSPNWWAMTRWDMSNKATKFEFSLFNMSQCVIQFGDLYIVTAQLQRAHDFLLSRMNSVEALPGGVPGHLSEF